MPKVVVLSEQKRDDWQTRFRAGQAPAALPYERDNDLLAVGQDRGCDYATLLDAVRRTDLRLELVCKPENLSGLSIPESVVVHGTVPHEQYRDMVRRTKVMAVPTHVLAAVPRARRLVHGLTS